MNVQFPPSAAPPFDGHRTHWSVNEIGEVPVQLPFDPVSACPWTAEPEIVGSAVFFGADAVVTVEVALDSALSWPAPFVAVTRTRRRDPTSELPTAYVAEVALVAQALAERYRPAKINYQVLGNAEPHVHTHVVPRYVDDRAPEHPLPPPDDATPVPDERLRTEVAALRAIIHG